MSHPCRVCQASETEAWMAFGPQPNSVRLLTSPEEEAGTHPLTLAHCPACGFIFIADPMPAEEFYGEVQQVTSLFPARHLPWLVSTMRKQATDPLVYEIGCNDGYFLNLLREAGWSRLAGIEPSAGCAEQGRAAGLQVTTGYFGLERARQCVAEGFRPNGVVCRHVLEHILDLDDFLAGLAAILAPGGFVVLEMPDLEAMGELGDLSAVWEQHVNYFDLPVLTRLLGRFGLRVTASHRLPHGGGSLLVFLEQGEAPAPPPAPDRAPLKAALAATALRLRETLTRLHSQGKRVVAFGAGMRGTMLINLAGLGPSLACVLDDNHGKLGRFLPGSRLPIRPSSLLRENPPDVCLILPLSSREAERRVMGRFPEFLAAGGSFLEAIPDPTP